MHLLSLTSVVALRVAGVAVGVYLGAVAPAEFVAQARRAANLTAGYAPNMEPSVVVTLAAVLAVPGLAAALFAELLRCWAMNGKPFAGISHVGLGVSVACPIGFAIAVPHARVGYPSLLLLSGVGMVLFYVVRKVWLSVTASHGLS